MRWLDALRGWLAVGLAAVATGACGQALRTAGPLGVLSIPGPSGRSLVLSVAPPAYAPTAADSMPDERQPVLDLPRFSVIEIPRSEPPGFGPPRRPHRALSVRARWPSRALQSLGIATSECALHLRMPTRFNAGAGGSPSLEVSAQVRVACSY